MSELLKHESVVDSAIIDRLVKRADEVIRGIHADYFADKSYKEFLSGHFHKESVMAKVASIRFASGGVLGELKDAVVPVAREVYKDEEYTFHPIFYLRLSAPDFFQSERQDVALLDSQPHYDRPFGLKAYTFWLALEEANYETGCLCSFTKKEIHEHFECPWEEKNRYNYDRYLEVAAEIDPMLSEGIYSPGAKPGDLLSFDWTVLHGATRPQTRRRLSFDFRLVPRSHLATSPTGSVRVIDAMEESVDICNVNNLILIGDFIGASRILNDLGNSSKTRELNNIADAFLHRVPDASMLAPGANFSWRQEYEWLTAV